MTSCDTKHLVARCPRRPLQSGLRSILIATVLLAILSATIVFHFRTHLYLAHLIASGKLGDCRATPVLSMPDASKPDGWVVCRVGSIQFRLPPQMAANEERPGNGAPYRIFSDGPRSVMVSPPKETTDSMESLGGNLKMPPQGRGLSLPRLRLAWCTASSEDFRWSMSHDETRWLGWCIAMHRLTKHFPDGWAETMFSADLDGILFIRQNHQRAIFDWEANTLETGGFIHFGDKSVSPDPEWVRCICRSIRVSEESLSENTSKDQEDSRTAGPDGPLNPPP